MPQGTDRTTILRAALRQAVEEERELRDQYAAAVEGSGPWLRLAGLAALAHGRLIGFAVALAAVDAAEPSPTASTEPGLVLAAATLMALGTPDASGNAGSIVCELPEVVRSLIEQ